MRLKMAQCNIWDMPAPIMHEPPPLFLAVKLKDYLTTPTTKTGKTGSFAIVLCVGLNCLLLTIESCMMH